MQRIWILASCAVLAVAALGGCGPPDTSGLSDTERRETVASMYEGYRRGFPGVSEVSARDLIEMQVGDGVVLVDVREPEEIAVSRIPEAIAKEEFEASREEYRGKKVVAYCTIGARSGEYAEELGGEGIDAYNLEGGILAWLHAGQEVIDPTGEATDQVHVYGPKWDLAPRECTGVW